MSPAVKYLVSSKTKQCSANLSATQTTFLHFYVVYIHHLNMLCLKCSGWKEFGMKLWLCALLRPWQASPGGSRSLCARLPTGWLQGAWHKKKAFKSLSISPDESAQKPDLLRLCATYCVSTWQFLAGSPVTSHRHGTWPKEERRIDIMHTMSNQPSLDEHFIQLENHPVSTQSAMRF